MDFLVESYFFIPFRRFVFLICKTGPPQDSLSLIQRCDNPNQSRSILYVAFAGFFNFLVMPIIVTPVDIYWQKQFLSFFTVNLSFWFLYKSYNYKFWPLICYAIRNFRIFYSNLKKITDRRLNYGWNSQQSHIYSSCGHIHDSTLEIYPVSMVKVKGPKCHFYLKQKQ
jgi:hypothetical protein